jgi:hypothetical protein
LLGAATPKAHCQDVGMSFSYFVPKNGYFSTPISPFSLRGLGFNLNKYFGIQSGFSLYRMSGLSVIDMPFESQKPIVGPSFTLLVPLEAVIQMSGKQWEFNVKGGVFAFYSFDQKLNYGNLDEAIRSYESWLIANSEFDFDNNIGFGYHFGAEYVFYVNKQFGISLESNYFIGGSDLGLKGSYRGGTLDSSNNFIYEERLNQDYSDSRIDFTGLEISFGVIITNGR